jgi:hypothetical protein
MPKAIELWRSSRTLQLVSRASYFSHIFQAFNAAAQRDSKVQLQIGQPGYINGNIQFGRR